MINPHPGGLVESNQIALVGGNGQLEVAQDDVALALDAEAAAGQTRVGSDTEHTDVAANVHDAAAAQHAADTDNTASGDGGLQGRAGRHGRARAAASASDTCTVSHQLVDGRRATAAAAAAATSSGRRRHRNTSGAGDSGEAGRARALPVARALLGDLLGLVVAVGRPRGEARGGRVGGLGEGRAERRRGGRLGLDEAGAGIGVRVGTAQGHGGEGEQIRGVHVW